MTHQTVFDTRPKKKLRVYYLLQIISHQVSSSNDGTLCVECLVLLTYVWSKSKSQCQRRSLGLILQQQLYDKDWLWAKEHERIRFGKLS